MDTQPARQEIAPHRGLWWRLWGILQTRTVGVLIPLVLVCILLISLGVKIAIHSQARHAWQISGYYLDGPVHVLTALLATTWGVSIIALSVSHKFARALERLTIAIAMYVARLFLWIVIPMLIAPGGVSGWPLATAYSISRDTHYILATAPIPTDAIYRIFSAPRTRWDPIWKVEFSSPALDYSEDGSLTGHERLILSGDEHILVIGRGGHLTDAIDLATGKPLATHIPWTAASREAQWGKRTEFIRDLLARHGGKRSK